MPPETAADARHDDALDRAVVETFLHALEDGDVDGAVGLLHRDVVYTNVGAATIRGARNVGRVFRPLLGSGAVSFEAHNHRVAAEDGTVLTERTDVLAVGPFRWSFWVCGTFEVANGRIVLWRDHFDWATVSLGLVRGLVGVVLPVARPAPPEHAPGRDRVPRG